MARRIPWVTTQEPITKYTPELLAMASAYAESYEIFGDVVPTAAGLAVVLKVSAVTLWGWNKDDDKPEITYILDIIKAKQEVALINKGLVGKYNSTITKLLLTKHGYTDKQDSNITGGFNVHIDNKDAGTL